VQQSRISILGSKLVPERTNSRRIENCHRPTTIRWGNLAGFLGVHADDRASPRRAGHAAQRVPGDRSEDQRTGGARDRDGGADFAGDGRGVEVLSEVSCLVARSLVMSAPSLSTLSRSAARLRDIGTS